jgi:hypothetical protein
VALDRESSLNRENFEKEGEIVGGIALQSDLDNQGDMRTITHTHKHNNKSNIKNE